MRCFNYEPEFLPRDEWFSEKATENQNTFLGTLRESRSLTGSQMKLLFHTILEAYGYTHPIELNKGTASVVIDFMKSAPKEAQLQAEGKAFAGAKAQEVNRT